MYNHFLTLLIFFFSFSIQLSAASVRAAFDVGSGQTKIAIAKVDDETGRPVEILFTEETALTLGHDFKKSKTGELSNKILSDLQNILIRYRDIALELGAKELAGVATAVFRESKNGADYIKKVKGELGIDLKLISQAEEGRIGFLTAVAASGKETGEIVAWDSGGGSFQISADGEEKLIVYEGKWGASKVLAAMVEKVQNKDFTKVQTANPATLEDVAALQKIVQTSLYSPEKELKAKFDNQALKVIAIGGPYSPFKMAEVAIGSTSFTKGQLWKAITELAGYSDTELAARFLEPEMLIPRLTLIYTVMDFFGIHQVDYKETTGSTLGILMSPQFWAK